MALTGLDIYKLLPKTNCKDCGAPTCLAFAMKLAQKKASLEECPHASEEAKQTLLSASEPPIRTITIGSGNNKIDLGGETVLFRHEKTFYHPCGLGIVIEDNISQEQLDSVLSEFNKLEFDRVGQKVRTEIIAIKNVSDNTENFISAVKKIKEKVPNANMVLISSNITGLEEILKLTKTAKPAIGMVNEDNFESMANLSKTYQVPIIIDGKDIDDISTLVQKIVSIGCRDILLNIRSDNAAKCLENLVQPRRLALKKNFRALGYPTVVFITDSDPMSALSLAAMAIAKYGSMVLLPSVLAWQQLALVTLRQNIYTDPQKPVIVEPKLYTIGGTPTDKSPVLVTTNFSLTYFTVEPEIINSKIPTWLLVVDTEGMSVLTAWAAEKFTADRVVQAMKTVDIESKVQHRKLIIPGYVAVMSGRLNESSGWEVIVGPREASGIPKFLKTSWTI